MRAAERVRDPLINSILVAFRRFLIPTGRVLWVSEGDSEPTYASRTGLARLGIRILQPHSLPNVVIFDPKRDFVALVDKADRPGIMTLKHREAVTEAFHMCEFRLISVTAFTNRLECRDSQLEIPWETFVWFAEEPNHLVYFDGGRLFGPRGI